MSESSSSAVHRVVLVAFDQYTDIDVVILWDLLNRIDDPSWSVRILGDRPQLQSMSGLVLPVHGPLSEAHDADAVLFASGRGTRLKMKDPDFLGQFHFDLERQIVGSICSGALLLAALGLLGKGPATTYPTAVPLLQSLGVEVREAPFVSLGRVATAGGCLAAQYLAGWVIEHLRGRELRERVLRSCQPVGEGLSFSTDLRGLKV